MDNRQDVHPSATVLVVDDTPDNLMLIADLLKDKYRVKAANSGDKALRLLQGDPLPDLILLDIMMPGLSGYEVAEQLKRGPRTRHICCSCTMMANNIASLPDIRDALYRCLRSEVRCC